MNVDWLHYGYGLFRLNCYWIWMEMVLKWYNGIELSWCCTCALAMYLDHKNVFSMNSIWCRLNVCLFELCNMTSLWRLQICFGKKGWWKKSLRDCLKYKGLGNPWGTRQCGGLRIGLGNGQHGQPSMVELLTKKSTFFPFAFFCNLHVFLCNNLFYSGICSCNIGL